MNNNTNKKRVFVSIQGLLRPNRFIMKELSLYIQTERRFLHYFVESEGVAVEGAISLSAVQIMLNNLSNDFSLIVMGKEEYDYLRSLLINESAAERLLELRCLLPGYITPLCCRGAGVHDRGTVCSFTRAMFTLNVIILIIL